MADKNVLLHDAAGNNLYPQTKAGNISGQLPVANGGTGATTAAGAIVNLLAGVTEYTDSDTVTGSTQYSITYTASGTGLIFANISIACDGTSGSGAAFAQIQKNGEWMAHDYTYLSTSSTPGIAANSSFMCKVAAGDKIKLIAQATKAGTKTVKHQVLAFGCTMTTS